MSCLLLLVHFIFFNFRVKCCNKLFKEKYFPTRLVGPALFMRHREIGGANCKS